MRPLNEVSRRNLVGKTKVYSPARYDKRLKYAAMSIPEVDEDELLNNDMLVLTIQVGAYSCVIAYKGVISRIVEIAKNSFNHRVNRRLIVRALNEQIDLTDVYVRCSCPDFKCFTADTKIKLLSGESLSIKEIADKVSQGQKLWVYSTDSAGDFRPGEVEYAGMTGTTTKLTKVTLDNEHVIECTPDHLFMLRDGTYKAAKDLVAGQSLMPLYFKYNNGYEAVKCNSVSYPTSYRSVYKLVAKYCLADEIEQAKIRSGEDTIAIHHKDYCKCNNNPDNLYPMGFQEHYMYHAKSPGNPQAMIDFWKDTERSAEARKKQRQAASAYMKNMWKSMSEEERSHYAAKVQSAIDKEKFKSSLKYSWDKLSAEERASRLCNNSFITKNPMLPENRREDAFILRNKCISEHHKKLASNLREAERRLRCEPMRSAPWTADRRMKAADSRRLWWNNLKSDPAKYQAYLEKQRSSQTGKRASDETRKKIADANIRSYEEKLAKLPEHRRHYLLEKRRINSIKVREHFPKSQATLISRTKSTLLYLIENSYAITEDNYNKYKNNKSPKLQNLPISFDRLREFFGLLNYNHTVVNVETVDLEMPVDVYDLSVKDHHNFLLDAGVVVHNCRFAYWASRFDYIYGSPERRPANITNPQDDIGATCKHLCSVLSNKKWLVKAVPVVNDFIHNNYDAIIKQYRLDPSEFVIDQARYAAMIPTMVKNDLRRPPMELLGAASRTYTPQNIGFELEELLSNKGWYVRVDYDLNKPIQVLLSKSEKALDNAEDSADDVYVFDVLPAGTKVRLKRVTTQ